MQNQNIEQYTEESPLADEGRKLLGKLDNTIFIHKFFIHALLQEMLFNMVQYSDIHYTHNKGYINDGCAGNILDYETLHKKVVKHQEPEVDDENRSILYYTSLGNPFTREILEFATVLFHDIKYPDAKIIDSQSEEIFLFVFQEHNGIILYKEQYEEALEVLKDQREMPDYVPVDIQKFVLKYQLFETKVINEDQYEKRLLKIESKELQEQIANASTPKEIAHIINAFDSKQHNNKIIIYSNKFQQKYQEAESLGLAALKNFFLKFLAWLYSLFYGEDENKMQERYNEIDRNDTRTINFKQFVTKEISVANERIIGQQQ